MSSNHQRLIDKEPEVLHRQREMQVLVLGMSRTGTSSIYTAFQQLGLHPYHMAEAIKDPRKIFPLWEDALKAKYYGEGPAYGRKEFDKMLGDFDAVADVPCCLFIDELVQAYPDAKVVLTNRDVDSWLVSANKTIFEVMSWWSWRYLAPFDPNVIYPWYHFASMCGDTIFGRCDLDQARQNYIEHYAHVRRAVPKDRLLEFKSQDGWEPLCQFLGKDVPSTEYPHVTDAAEFVRMHKMLWYRSLAFAVGKSVLACAPVGAAIFAWYYTRK